MPLNHFKNYLSFEKKYSAHTITSYLNDLNDFSAFLKANYDLEIQQANVKQIRAWISILSQRNLSANSINRKIASLKSFYKFLLKTDSIEKNPTTGISTMKSGRKIPLPFSETEMQNVLDESIFADDFEGKRDHLIIHLFYTTGMRRAELINLKVSDIDFSKKEVKVLGKRNKERIIPLLNETLDLLYRYIDIRKTIDIQDQDFLFLTKKGKKMYDVLVYRLINSYLGKVSVKHKKSPHMLRHTFATHLLNKGADLNSIKELLGHTGLAATQIYTHSGMQELKKIYNKAHPRSKK